MNRTSAGISMRVEEPEKSADEEKVKKRLKLTPKISSCPDLGVFLVVVSLFNIGGASWLSVNLLMGSAINPAVIVFFGTFGFISLFVSVLLFFSCYDVTIEVKQ